MGSMRRTPLLARAWLVAALLGGHLAAGAAVIEGHVVGADGKPVPGALVTLAKDDELLRETVYTNRAGRYELGTAQTGEARLQVRAPGYADQVRKLSVVDARAVDWVLTPSTDPQALSDAMPASAFAAIVKIDDKKVRTEFRSQCFFCHQIGNAWTRKVRNQEEWEAVTDRMQRYGALITWHSEKTIIASLMDAFKGAPLADHERRERDPEIATARLTEVRVGEHGAFLHDVDIGPDGRFYSCDMANDAIYATDLATARSTVSKMPSFDQPLHGDLAGGSAPVAAFNAHHGPHSIVRGPDGRFYTTNSMSAEIGVFDPATGVHRFVKIGHGAIYPHTLRFDKNGIAWFSIAMSDQIGRYDPRTDAVQVINLPSGGFWQWLADEMFGVVLKVASWFPGQDLHLILSHHKWSGQGHKILNLPYGIDVDPRDGSVWYSKLYADKIGRYDPATGKVEEFSTPEPGPRRLRFGSDGTLWIPAFGGSALMKFDTATRRFTSYPMPVLDRDEFETPYAVNVEPHTGDVWVTSNLSDRMFRFNPQSEKWVAYPLPTRVTYLRDIVFMADGGVCSTNSNLPSDAVEGRHQSLLCLHPDAVPENGH
jgi:streptogramin lyase